MLAEHMRKQAKKDMTRVANGYIEGVKYVGIDAAPVISPLLRFEDIPSIYEATPGSKVVKGKPKTIEREYNGKTYKYTLNEKTGKYE